MTPSSEAELDRACLSRAAAAAELEVEPARRGGGHSSSSNSFWGLQGRGLSLQDSGSAELLVPDTPIASNEVPVRKAKGTCMFGEGYTLSNASPNQPWGVGWIPEVFSLSPAPSRACSPIHHCPLGPLRDAVLKAEGTAEALNTHHHPPITR